METISYPYLVSSDLGEAVKLAAKGLYSEAAWIARNSIKAEGGSPRAFSLLADCAVAMGDTAAAAKYATKSGMKKACQGDGADSAVRGVFVGGTGRSGTSLLRRMLNSNPDIGSIPGETKCINDARFRLAPHWFNALPRAGRGPAVDTLKDLWREQFYCYAHPVKASVDDDLRRGLCLWLDREALEAELARLDRLAEARSLHETERVWGDLYAALFDRGAEARGKRLWVEKTPKNSLFAEHLYSMLPGMRLINVVRDGRDVALSMQNVVWGEKDLVKALDWWAEELDATMRALDGLPESAVLTIRYEDLVSEPDAVMADIAGFLGVPPVYDLDIFVSSVGRWKSDMPAPVQAHGLERHRALFERFGYDVAAPVEAGPVRQAPKGFDMKKRNDGTRYMADLVLPLRERLKCVLMRDVEAEAEACFFLRHDVDDDIDAALRMAQLEYENGVRAAYFLLPPSPSMGGSNYYGSLDGGELRFSDDLVRHAKRLLDWGHEVGLHNNIAEVAVHLGRDVAEVLAQQVAFFSGHGIRLTGSAAHGGPFFHDNGFVSFEIFAEGGVKPGFERGRTIEAGGRALTLHALRQADFGFAYEAYSLPYEIGLNDSNGVWGGKLVRQSSTPGLNELKGARFLAAFREMVATARPDMGVQKLQVLVHPEHWAIC